MNQTTRRNGKRRTSQVYTPPRANLAELQALDDLRRAWDELNDARAATKVAMSPLGSAAAASRIALAQGKIRRAHRTLDALFAEET